MGAFLLVGVVLSSLLLCGCRAEPDCCALGFGKTTLSNGNDSSVCVRDTQDCCTTGYLDQYLHGRVQPALDQYLSKEYRVGIADVHLKLKKLIEYFSEHSFERDIIQVLATPTSQEASNHETALVNLTGVLSEEPADQSICETISTGVTRVVVNIAEAYFSRKELSEENKVCIYNTTNSEIDKHSLEHMGSGLVELYHYTLRALAKIQDFIESQVNRTEGASVSAVCVDGFIEAAFCRQCVERTPPLCLLTCNALVRGCYSPYYTVLNGQFEDLWTEVKRLTRSADSAVKNVLSNTLKLVQFPQLLSDIRSECGLTTEGDVSSNKEEGEVGINSTVLEPLLDITGPFQYGDGDLQLCRFSVDEDACLEPTQGPQTQGCDPQDLSQLKNDTYTSDPGTLSISECDCFDGVEFTTDEETSRFFETNDIHDQGDNPVFQPPLNVTELENKSSAIKRQQGNPVEEFLESKDYTELLENQGSNICSGDPTTVSPAPTTEDGSTTLASLTAVLFIAMFVANFSP